MQNSSGKKLMNLFDLTFMAMGGIIGAGSSHLSVKVSA